MTLRVYEVEMEPITEGQRFCQHIKAESAAEAGSKVHALQKRTVIGITVWRECTQAEIDAANGVINLYTPVPFNPEDWKEP